jgi:hypothetical protein
MTRLAYVIGNNEYKNWIPLQNPVNDANGISDVLLNVGFKVRLFTNLDFAGLTQSIYEFGQELKNYRVGLFYFAGHGVEFSGENYLIPIDAQISSVGLIAPSSVKMTLLLDWLSNYKENTNIVILDSCRTNISLGGTRGLLWTGLFPVNGPSGTFISYSTSANSKALDGKKNNSAFTEALIRFIPSEGDKIEDTFKKVRSYVQKETNGDQQPCELSSLVGDFYFLEPRHHFSKDGITPEKIYDYAESIWDDFESRYSSDKAEALVFLEVSRYFQIPLLEVYRGYSVINNKQNPKFSDKELCVLGLERFKGIGFKEQNHRWYYDGNPIRMGEILPLPPELEIMLPEEGQEIVVDIDVKGTFENEKYMIFGKCNLPVGMYLMMSFRSQENNCFAQDKVEVVKGGLFTSGFTNRGDKISKGKYKLEASTPIFDVQPEEIKPFVGIRCRNLVGKNVEFNVIGGNTVNFSLVFEINY